jgi:hypothetical protein
MAGEVIKIVEWHKLISIRRVNNTVNRIDLSTIFNIVYTK